MERYILYQRFEILSRSLENNVRGGGDHHDVAALSYSWRVRNPRHSAFSTLARLGVLALAVYNINTASVN
jgi:hypothetical protein